MALNAWQQAYLQDARKRYLTVDDVSKELGVSVEQINKALSDAGETLATPAAELFARTADEAKKAGKPFQLTEGMNAIIGQAETRTVQDVLKAAQNAGVEGLSYNRAQRILDAAGMSMPLTRGGMYANEAQDAMAKGELYQLTPWMQDIYNQAKTAQLSSADLAQWQNMNGIPVTRQEIDTIIKGAGLEPLLGRQPYKQPGATVPSTATSQQPPAFPGGLPGAQPEGGGMYGNAPKIDTPTWVTGNVPNHPMLKGVFRNARRRNTYGWRGQTDTILTTARGVLNAAQLAKPKLQGRV